MIFTYINRFFIEKSPAVKDEYFFRDLLSFSGKVSRTIQEFDISRQTDRGSAFSVFFPPVIPVTPLSIHDRPLSAGDINFWQYPVTTELHAWCSHGKLGARSFDPAGCIHSYLGLPWATYIDKQCVDESMAGLVRSKIMGFRMLAELWGLRWSEDIKLHSVCQHIYWDRLLPVFKSMGITDLHISHCDRNAIELAKDAGVRLHSWPLVAANQVNPDRQIGLSRTAPLRQRTYLASFVGSHMGHYRSDVRLRLKKEVERSGRKDVIFKLGDEWHYNSIVYDEQVGGRSLDEASKRKEAEATRLYNEVMSNSVFALCPEGAGPNTIRLWEALAAGAIPVIIVEDWIWPEIRGLQLSWDDVAICCRRDDVMGLIDHLHFLLENCSAKLERMQRDGRKVYDHFSSLTCFPAP